MSRLQPDSAPGMTIKVQQFTQNLSLIDFIICAKCFSNMVVGENVQLDPSSSRCPCTVEYERQPNIQPIV